MSDVRGKMTWQATGMVFTGTTAKAPPTTFDGNGVAGPTPVETVLLALAGCIGSDIVDIAEKSRVALRSLEVTIDGDRAAEPPRRYTAVRAYYRVGADEADRPKIERAVQLSHEKYCSVLHSLRTDIAFSSELELI